MIKVFPVIFLFLLLSAFLVNPLQNAAAQDGIGITQQPKFGIQIKNQSSGALVGNLIRNLTYIFFSVAAVGVTIMFLWGSVEWILSGGDKEKVAAARKRITTALIGLALLSLSFVIIGVIGQILGIDFFGRFYIPSFGDLQPQSGA